MLIRSYWNVIVFSIDMVVNPNKFQPSITNRLGKLKDNYKSLIDSGIPDSEKNGVREIFDKGHSNKMMKFLLILYK